MLYKYDDIKVLKDQLEFVDTAVIPLVSTDMDSGALSYANDIELLQLVTIQLEKQFKGRIFITPAMTTVNSDTTVLEQYEAQLYDYGFKNVVMITHMELDKSHTTIRLNHIPLQDMTNDIKMDMVKEEVKKVMKSIISIWNS
jgi:hypothetical protein